jgi:hypothetical protein
MGNETVSEAGGKGIPARDQNEILLEKGTEIRIRGVRRRQEGKREDGRAEKK